jgi:hypothetical protein
MKKSQKMSLERRIFCAGLHPSNRDSQESSGCAKSAATITGNIFLRKSPEEYVALRQVLFRNLDSLGPSQGVSAAFRNEMSRFPMHHTALITS